MSNITSAIEDVTRFALGPIITGQCDCAGDSQPNHTIYQRYMVIRLVDTTIENVLYSHTRKALVFKRSSVLYPTETTYPPKQRKRRKQRDWLTPQQYRGSKQEEE